MRGAHSTGRLLLAAIIAMLAGGRADMASAATPGEARPHVEIVTARENVSLPPDTLVLLVTGPIVAPMRELIAEALAVREGTYDVLIVDLNSDGGELGHAEHVASLLNAQRDRTDLKTYVRNGSRCLSACILAFMEGEERIAGSASTWLFHGVCPPFHDRPSLLQTQRFIDLLQQAGVSEPFVCELVDQGYFTQPGDFWASGYELFHVYDAKIITRLIEQWRPARATK